MNWFLWALVALFAANAVATILNIGKQRTPITPGDAAFLVIVDALIVAGILLFA